MTVRDAFFNYLYEKSVQGIDIKVVTPDLGAPSLDEFRRDFPARYISVGISEQNMIAVAAGMASNGANVVAYGLNPFPITRAFDQVRNLMSSLQIPIILTALNVGTCSAQAGYTHMPIEDYTITRCLEGMITFDVSCAEMSRMSLDYALKCRRPVYIRFDKRISECIYASKDVDFAKGYVSRGNGSLYLLSYGFMARQAYIIQEKLVDKGIQVKVIDIFSNHFDRKSLLGELVMAQCIMTLEDNVLPGGFGSMIVEFLADNDCRIPVWRKGIMHYDSSILQDWRYIHRQNGLDEETLLNEISRRAAVYGK